MSRLFAFMANDPDRVRCALYPARSLLVTPAAEARSGRPIDGWGIGFYQGGEVLLQRRPKAPTDPVDFYALTRELRTDYLIGHVRAGTFGTPKNENTHPFRFRSWLFAHHGSVPAFAAIRDALLGHIPDFLRRNIRGETDSEHLFHLLLALLHETGRIDDPGASVSGIRDALRATLALVDRLVGEAVAAGRAKREPEECALALTNGRVLLATRRGGPVHLLCSRALVDCPVCRETSPQPGRAPKRIDHEHLRSVIVVADAPEIPGPPWRELQDDSMVCVSRDLVVDEVPIRVN